QVPSTVGWYWAVSSSALGGGWPVYVLGRLWSCLEQVSSRASCLCWRCSPAWQCLSCSSADKPAWHWFVVDVPETQRRSVGRPGGGHNNPGSRDAAVLLVL